jgi:RHS repeat-associated protein
MPERKYPLNGDYRFGFNGKENDKEWGNQLIQDYGFRLYNPAIGKFLSVDPLAPEYPFYSPYHFAGNNPILYIDLDGLEPIKPSQKNKEITKIRINNYAGNLLVRDFAVGSAITQDHGPDLASYTWYLAHHANKSSRYNNNYGGRIIGAIGEVVAINQMSYAFSIPFHPSKKYVDASFNLNPSPSSRYSNDNWDFEGRFSRNTVNYWVNQVSPEEKKKVKNFSMNFYNSMGIQSDRMIMEFYKRSSYHVVFEVKTYNAHKYQTTVALYRAISNAITQTNRHVTKTGADYGVLVLPTALWDKAIELGINGELHNLMDNNTRLFLIDGLRVNSEFIGNQIIDDIKLNVSDEAKDPGPVDYDIDNTNNNRG